MFFIRYVEQSSQKNGFRPQPWHFSKVIKKKLKLNLNHLPIFKLPGEVLKNKPGKIVDILLPLLKKYGKEKFQNYVKKIHSYLL